MKKYISFSLIIILLTFLFYSITFSQKKKKPILKDKNVKIKLDTLNEEIKELIEQIKEEPVFANVKSKDSNSINTIVPLTKEQIERVNIFYIDSLAQTALNSDVKSFLNAACKYLKENAKANIYIVGHSNNNFISVEENSKYSNDLAFSVLKFLLSKGISKNRIFSFGIGNKQPITNSSVENFKNYRIEIKFKNQ